MTWKGVPLRVRRRMSRAVVRVWGGVQKRRTWERFVWRRRPHDRWRARARYEMGRTFR
jgi:hypothetical protein